MIKNAVTMQFETPFNLAAEVIDAALITRRFEPCTSSQAQATGWGVIGESLLGEQAYAKAIGPFIVMQFVHEKKTVPSSAIKQEMKKRARAWQKENGEVPGKDALKEMKELVMAELMCRAFSKIQQTYVWVDTNNNTLNFDATSDTKVSTAFSYLARSVEGLPATFAMSTKTAPQDAMKEWLLTQAPDCLSIDDKCELTSFIDNKPTIKYVRHDLGGTDVKDHIMDGKVPVSLALTFNDRMSFMLTNKFGLKSIAPLGVMKADLADEDPDDAEAMFASEFLLMAGEIAELTSSLVENMGGYNRIEVEESQDAS